MKQSDQQDKVYRVSFGLGDEWSECKLSCKNGGQPRDSVRRRDLSLGPIGQNPTRLPQARHIILALFFQTSTAPLHGEMQHDGQSRPCAKFPTTLYPTELAHELPAGPLHDLAALKKTSYGVMDRAQHPSLMAPNRRSKRLTSRDSL